MCGITGFFNNPKAAEKAVKALETIKNRGMDGAGFFDGKNVFTAARIEDLKTKKNASNNCIAHCLHSVVGNVRQPIKNKGVLAANCEIYNWKELNEKYGINARNDAELLLRMLEKEKNIKKALDKLNGVFAFAYWKGNRVWLARDILGEKPLWYSLEKGLAFASEKKALEKLGHSKVIELHPRKILLYSTKENKAQFVGQKFFELKKETNKSFEETKKVLEKILAKSIKSRAPGKKFGILFSGGVDSTLLALLCRKLGLDFSCYTGGIIESGRKMPDDILFAKKTAGNLGLDFKAKTIGLSEAEKYFSKIVPLIEDSNVVKAGVGLPLFLACEKAKEDGVKVVFSGTGADELFAGYARFEAGKGVNNDCLSLLRRAFERDLYRDDVVCMANNTELRQPFLDRELVEFALSVPEKFKTAGNAKKIILRELAKGLGLPEKIAERKKTAAQYGSNSDWAIEKLAKKAKCKTKSEYLGKFYPIPNLVIGALASGGKDSLLAMQTMRRQNYEIACLITLRSKNMHSFMFHTPNIGLVKLQAEAMNMPLIMQETHGKKEAELKDLERAIKKAISKFGIQGIVSGALYSNYQRERIEKIAEELGIKVFSPLWHANQEQELLELLKNNYRIVFSAVASHGLGKEVLGKEITKKEVEKLEELNKKFGLNISGEGGEYESLVLDAPFFMKKIKLVETEILETGASARLVVKKAMLESK